MCIIIYKDKVATIDKETLRTAFKNNPDGAGFMAQTDQLEKPVLKKGFFNFDDFYAAYEEFANSPKGYNIAVHFRIATHGAVNKLNCHPFVVDSTPKGTIRYEGQHPAIFMQNGVIKSITTNKNDKYSDTCNFTYKIINNLVTLKSAKIKSIVESLEPNSKFVLMQEGRQPLLMGVFTTDKGVKYSNTSYKPRTYTYTGTYNYSTLSFLLEIKGAINKVDEENVKKELAKNSCQVNDSFIIGDTLFAEVSFIPAMEKIAGFTFNCYQ